MRFHESTTETTAQQELRIWRAFANFRRHLQCYSLVPMNVYYNTLHKIVYYYLIITIILLS